MSEYQELLDTMEVLIEDYDAHQPVIDFLVFKMLINMCVTMTCCKLIFLVYL
ncbi:hypothetical protein [Photobacterium frigidiphilum]|uniref:hypothetical protein n=1 Tax=Photobacterium frigidiphilum TaxID=264736 RepID=UPI001D131800|nr:hypothetical protein [Photobacterium frigidiphilum]